MPLALSILDREPLLRDSLGPKRVDGQMLTLLCLLEASDGEGRLAHWANRLKGILEGSLKGVSVSVGVGRVHEGLEGMRRSCQEAEQALMLGVRLFGPGSVTLFGQLGLYRLLLSIYSNPEMESFCNEILGKLLAYDRSNRSELIPTLEALLQSNNSPTEAARRLHVHRNTLLYRLRRIEEIASIHLGDPETRLSLFLALRILKVKQTIANPI